MNIEKVHDVISFKQSKWLEKYKNFNTQKRNLAVYDFEKDFYKILNNAFYGKTMENVRTGCKIEIIERNQIVEIRKQQSKLTFDGIHKSYENCDSYLFKENEITMDKLIYLGFATLELSKLHMYETYYDKLQPYFGQDKLKLHYIDTDCFVLSIDSDKTFNDLKILENISDFSNLDKNYEIYSTRNKKVVGKFKIETPKNVFLDKFGCLRSKMYAFKCKDEIEAKNKLKGISKSQPKNIIFQEHYNSVYGKKVIRECENCILGPNYS